MKTLKLNIRGFEIILTLKLNIRGFEIINVSVNVAVYCMVKDHTVILFCVCIERATGFFFKEIARHLRPRTLRARFGKNKVQNAVHCTDLPEDGLLEVIFYITFRSERKI